MDQVGRCTGHCCEDFTLPVSPMQFKWWAKLIKLGKRVGMMKHTPFRKWLGELYDSNRGYFSTLEPDDVAKIADMVQFKYASKTCKGNPGRKIPNLLYHYTCKHYDKKSGNCMNYEDRPGMCRAYPNVGECSYKGCTSPCAKKAKPAKEISL